MLKIYYFKQDNSRIIIDLVTKLLKLQHKIALYTNNEQEEVMLSHKLWTFETLSFLPNHCGQTPDNQTPIWITTTNQHHPNYPYHIYTYLPQTPLETTDNTMFILPFKLLNAAQAVIPPNSQQFVKDSDQSPWKKLITHQP